MSDAEIERLFRAIEALRDDLHKLDIKITEIETREDAARMSKSDLYKIVTVSATIVSTATAIAMQIFDRL